VIWTDVVQTVIYVGGTLVGLWTILHLVPGGWAPFMLRPRAPASCRSSTSPQLLDSLHILGRPRRRNVPHHASHGTDQLIVQRLAGGAQRAQSVTALLSSGIAILFQFAMFLMVGVMLWAYYRVPSASFGTADRIYPTFIVSRMPHGISGLLIAAILAAAMSNLSAALNALSSTSIMDFYVRFRPRPTNVPTHAALSRISTFVWALLLFALRCSRCTKWGASSKSGCRSHPSPMALCWESFCSAC
jgi:solute:Na+ symporter, SSS family